MFDRFFLSERSLKLTLTTGALLILGIPVGIAVLCSAISSVKILALCAGMSVQA